MEKKDLMDMLGRNPARLEIPQHTGLRQIGQPGEAPAQRRRLLLVEPQDGGHRAGVLLPGQFHEPAALLNHDLEGQP